MDLVYLLFLIVFVLICLVLGHKIFKLNSKIKNIMEESDIRYKSLQKDCEDWVSRYKNLAENFKKIITMNNEKNDKMKDLAQKIENLLIERSDLIKEKDNLINMYKNGVFYDKENDKILEISSLERIGDLD